MRPLLVGLLILALATGLAILHRRRKRRSRALPLGARLDITVVMCTAGADAIRRTVAGRAPRMAGSAANGGAEELAAFLSRVNYVIRPEAGQLTEGRRTPLYLRQGVRAKQ
ncbi:hypothetical protein [Sorangium sp. So ce1153]|uniref:hypothetical protein n=1 Tax=Sorangium sp. So ce1153 TaxID=3133333 RepID=UPI003F5E45DC